MPGEAPAERGRRNGGEAWNHNSGINAAQSARYLNGVSFPANNTKISSTARSNGAPEKVIKLFDRLPERKDTPANEFQYEFCKLK